MGWCIQALKAAQIAGLGNQGLDESCRKAVAGIKRNFKGGYELGGFGYTSPGAGGLTGVGVLCLQLLGAAKSDEVTGGLAYLDGAQYQTYDLDNPAPGSAAMYYWYYVTQAKFHAGGKAWNKWNRMFSHELVVKQHKILKEQSGYVDHKGIPRETGFWDQYKGHGSDNPVFATLMCVLQLEVYYKCLPTFNMKIDQPVRPPADGLKPERNLDIRIVQPKGAVVNSSGGQHTGKALSGFKGQ
jgi:hypothetical protein